jgi:hypothetical protein
MGTRVSLNVAFGMLRDQLPRSERFINNGAVSAHMLRPVVANEWPAVTAT